MPHGGFAERLAWLLKEVPREAGSQSRFSVDDVVAVLAVAVPEGGTSEATPMMAAREWLSQARAATPSEDLRGAKIGARYIAALEDLFRLPAGYFENDDLAAQVDSRIAFVNSAAAGGMRLHGPCRVSASELTSEEIVQVHSELERVLTRGRHS